MNWLIAIVTTIIGAAAIGIVAVMVACVIGLLLFPIVAVFFN